jgi:hypothetical protein
MTSKVANHAFIVNIVLFNELLTAAGTGILLCYRPEILAPEHDRPAGHRRVGLQQRRPSWSDKHHLQKFFGSFFQKRTEASASF